MAVKRLEIKADKEVRLRRLELELEFPQKGASQLEKTGDGKALISFSSPVTKSRTDLDITKAIPILPQFHESEVDAYFHAFERIVTTLNWPKDMWSLML